MYFFPTGCLLFLAFILALPILLILGFFHVVNLGFENLGLSSEITLLILFLMLVGSSINIPLTRRKIIYTKESSFFGLFSTNKLRASGIFINLGGAVIPVLLSFYFLTKIPLEPVLIAVILMVIVTNLLSRPIPRKGIGLPVFVPPFFATLFALIISPEWAAPTAFISGVLGTLIGADILNLRKIQKLSPGMISIGGAGVFDGIFLIGIISALLAGF